MSKTNGCKKKKKNTPNPQFMWELWVGLCGKLWVRVFRNIEKNRACRLTNKKFIGNNNKSNIYAHIYYGWLEIF